MSISTFTHILEDNRKDWKHAQKKPLVLSQRITTGIGKPLLGCRKLSTRGKRLNGRTKTEPPWCWEVIQGVVAFLLFLLELLLTRPLPLRLVGGFLGVVPCRIAGVLKTACT